jgi:flavin reductase (DIM6/NTAB) family NADH-FMN oxidoreductase RutF
MYYETDKNDHGLKFNPFKSLVIPRPIGWISTLSADGVVNLAPYSQFIMLNYNPPCVMISAGAHPEGNRLKDTVRNIEQTGEFVFNMATYDLRDAVNRSSTFVGPEVDEMTLAGLTPAPSKLVKPPRVAESPVHFECRWFNTTTIPGYTPRNNSSLVMGQVIAIHIDDDCLTPEGRVDVLKIRPLARLGYYDYTSVESVFEMPPLDEGELAKHRRGSLVGEATGKPGA